MSEKTAAPQVYGADEINAVVLDPGSYSTQIGFAGYDQPTIVSPSYYGVSGSGDEAVKCFDENLLFSNYKQGLQIKPIMENDIVVDWEGAISQYGKMIKDLDVNPNEQPLLLTEPTFNSYNGKVKSMEYFFEQEEFCAFYAVKKPTCVSFAHGRPNCLVVDVGHDLLTITPVIDGLCLNSQALITKYAGGFLNQQLKQLLHSKTIDYHAPFQVKSKIATYWEGSNSVANFVKFSGFEDVHQSVIDFSYLRTLREMKELLLECCMDDEIKTPETKETAKDSEDDESDEKWFELPDGMNVPFSLYERQKLSNSLFNPSDLLNNDVLEGWEESYDGNPKKIFGKMNSEESKNGAVKSKEYVPLRRNNGKKPEDEDNKKNSKKENGSVSNNANGIVTLIQKALDNLDIDLKPQLANNIVVTGSTSLIPRFNERINNELTINNPSLKIRLHSAGNSIERKHSSWIGGSILASLGTFHQLWVSKAEYEEVGPDQLIINRFR